MTNAHHTRAHAQWSASATARNVVCAGAIAMETMCEDRETEAAAWGTCAHQIAERCLKQDVEALSFLGDVEKSGKFEFRIDEEMPNTSQVYVDYCRGRIAEYETALGEKPQVWIEQWLSLDALDPPLEAGGTGDCVIYFPRWRLLEIVDLKGGRGVVVDVKGNPQGRSYGIGAVLAIPGIEIDRVRVTIVQPRVGDGAPKHDDFHVADLMDWTVDLLASMRRSRQALDEFTALEGNRVKFDEWAARWLTVGQCIFCPAKAICPAARAAALDVASSVARKWFEEPASEPLIVGNAPSLASPEELAHWLDGLDALEEWVKAVRGHAHAQAERGVSIPEWGLVDKIGNRAFIEKDEAKLAGQIKEKLALTDEQVFERSVRSVAQIEKILGAKRKAELAKLEDVLWHKPVKGTNLVRFDKTSRPAAKTKPEQYHEVIS
jgi:hypothetical protein